MSALIKDVEAQLVSRGFRLLVIETGNRMSDHYYASKDNKILVRIYESHKRGFTGEVQSTCVLSCPTTDNPNSLANEIQKACPSVGGFIPFRLSLHGALNTPDQVGSAFDLLIKEDKKELSNSSAYGIYSYVWDAILKPSEIFALEYTGS